MEKDKTFVVVGFPSPSDPKGSVGLGAYIFATNPYHAVLPPEGTWKLPYPPPVINLKEGYKRESVLYALDSTGIEQHQKPGNWKFKYAEHYVDRAIRIPYMYYTRSERTEDGVKDIEIGGDQIVLVRDYFLIGFEGGAGY